VPDNIIIEFVTGGPKNYAYKIARPDKDGRHGVLIVPNNCTTSNGLELWYRLL
jgi:hypothetical protein